MSLGDRFKRFFRSSKKPDLEELKRFAAQRTGVEGYIEPRTATNPTTLLLVDRMGDHVRAAVGDPREAEAFCKSSSIPVYDAAVVGYPKRMRGFDRGHGDTPESPGERFDPTVDERFEELQRRFAESDPDAPDR